MSRPVHLACAARADYLPHTATMLHSVLSEKTTASVQVHFLHGPDLTGEHRRLLAEMVDRGGGAIEYIEVDRQRVHGLRTIEDRAQPNGSVYPASHWYRVFLPELLPDVDRLLYLDGDVIVTDSLDPLWQTELAGHYIAAVTNVFEPWHAGRVEELGLGGREPYFNSGVMLMNLAEMRRDGCTEAILSYGVANADRLAWPEQDALNVVIGHRRQSLHPRWNCMNSVMSFSWSADVFGAQAVEEARRRPAIRHFEGPHMNKPWHYLCEAKMRQLYDQHRRETPWPSYTPDGATLRNRVRRIAQHFTATRPV